MRTFVVATATTALLVAGITTATADPIAPTPAAPAVATETAGTTTGSADPFALLSGVSSLPNAISSTLFEPLLIGGAVLVATICMARNLSGTPTTPTACLPI
ncbi:hypothetical protein [Nocardia stercoris]|uniref:Uncharacterized protein n=1 Tax=Nocardia stercoris TaxID=2483361 RepID=A0A3M2KW52_9NOCA|nr:hypothetical protein [Nocardia stercoris]RMI28690.1 hypothetical protein EBN03_29020 [Nocardia stercoris]